MSYNRKYLQSCEICPFQFNHDLTYFPALAGCLAESEGTLKESLESTELFEIAVNFKRL